MHTWVKENLQIRAPLIFPAFSQPFFNRTESVDCNIEISFGFYSCFFLSFSFIFFSRFMHSFIWWFMNSLIAERHIFDFLIYKSEFKNRLYKYISMFIQPFNSDGMFHISDGSIEMKQFYSRYSLTPNRNYRRHIWALYTCPVHFLLFPFFPIFFSIFQLVFIFT